MRSRYVDSRKKKKKSVEIIEQQRKLTRTFLAESSGNAPQRNKYVLARKCIIYGRDSLCVLFSRKWTIFIIDQRSNYAGGTKSFTTAGKRVLKLVEWQSLVAKCCELRKI